MSVMHVKLDIFEKTVSIIFAYRRWQTYKNVYQCRISVNDIQYYTRRKKVWSECLHSSKAAGKNNRPLLHKAWFRPGSILSMNIEELQEYIQNAALENPLISFESFSHIPAYDASADSRGFTEAVIDFGGQMAEANGFFEGTTRLRDYLIMQIPKRLNDRQYKVFYYIINSLDKNGFFREAETSQPAGSRPDGDCFRNA